MPDSIPHLLTLTYLEKILERPGMFYRDCDLTALENQVHGFDAALAATGALGNCSRFNPAFTSFVMEKTGLSGSLGWAGALLHRHGQTPEAEAMFWQLFGAFLSEVRPK